ncbi:MAG: PAS domain S-box protein [Proteobacteria bacterium]|nr:PAS domain S-box protein [Pseudomonadota bacterium]
MLIAVGMIAIASFHLADLLAVLGGRGAVASETPGLGYEWIATLVGTGAIFAGFVGLKRGLLTQLQIIGETRQNLSGELAAHRRTGDALHFSVRRFSEIVNIASDAIISVDKDQRIHLFNKGAEEIFGYAAQEMLGKPLDILLPERFRDAHRGQIGEFAGAPEASRLMSTRGKLMGRRKDGTEFPAEASISKVASDGETIFTVILHDVTLREQREAQLRHAQGLQAVGQLTGGVAHDFNNLLAVIMGNLELAQDELGDAPQSSESGARELVARAIAASERGAALTARLLAFSRRQALEPKVVDLNKLVAGTTELLRRTLGETIEVETVTAGGLWRCKVDPAQVESVLLNLAVNARDAMPGGGKLTIETANARLDDDYAAAHAEVTPGQYVMLAVTDNGTGMPAEVAERAFEPFFTTKDAGHGTGLGLSMIYGFVKQSEGHVKIYSEVGHGTTVRVYLPRSRAQESVVPDEPPVQEEEPGSLETLLVVEDDADVRELAVNMLQSLGYVAVEAIDAESALAALDRRPEIVLLFTDVVLPGGTNGAELARQARKRRPDLKVLYTSGYTDNAIIHKGVLDEEADMINKPFRKAALARKIRGILDRDRDAVA